MITTVEGRTFTDLESVDLARLIAKRFGPHAPEAWRRLLENQCDEHRGEKESA